MRQLGILNVTTKLLEKVLDFPDNADIISLHINPVKPGIVSLVVRSPFMPEVLEGAMLPNVTMAQIGGWDT